MKSYDELRKINVNDKIEKKGSLSYLSWAWAVDTLLQADPTATWTYSEPKAWGDTWMVFCTVTANSISRTAQLPVMDHKNKAIANPDAFQVNTAMQRCLAKAISLHGIGLYIYAGEDLPDGEDAPKTIQSVHKPTDGAWESMGEEEQNFLTSVAMEVLSRLVVSPEDAFDYLEEQKLDNDEKIALWTRFDSKTRSALKKVGDTRKQVKEAA